MENEKANQMRDGITRSTCFNGDCSLRIKMHVPFEENRAIIIYSSLLAWLSRDNYKFILRYLSQNLPKRLFNNIAYKCPYICIHIHICLARSICFNGDCSLRIKMHVSFEENRVYHLFFFSRVISALTIINEFRDIYRRTSQNDCLTILHIIVHIHTHTHMYIHVHLWIDAVSIL